MRLSPAAKIANGRHIWRESAVRHQKRNAWKIENGIMLGLESKFDRIKQRLLSRKPQ